MSYNDFKWHVSHGDLASVYSFNGSGGDIRGVLKSPAKPHNEISTTVPTVGDTSLIALLEANNVSINPPHAAPLGWDIVASAGQFATLAAVLAGFVFIAIVGILTIPPKFEVEDPEWGIRVREVRPGEPLVALVQAFLSLVVAAFLFGILAGQGPAAGRIDIVFEGFCVSWLMALGVVQTAVGIAWMLSKYDLDRRVVRAGNLLTTFSVGLATVFTAGVVVTPLYDIAPSQTLVNSAAWLLVFGPFVASILLALRWRKKKRGAADLYSMTPIAVVAVSIMTVTFSLITAVDSVSLVRITFPVHFFLTVLFQIGLVALFAVYLSSLPESPGDEHSLSPYESTAPKQRSRRRPRKTAVSQ